MARPHAAAGRLLRAVHRGAFRNGGQRQLKWFAGLVGAGSIGLAALVALLVGMDYHAQGAEPSSYFLWTWMNVGDFTPSIRLYLDGLSLVMMGVITGVGFLIHLYATGYMWDEDGYSRFFAYMNLFVFAMLMLVLGDNLLVLFLGWEGVGLCSYLLIGFFHKEPENGYAARKAFVVTRVGDTAMLLGLFLLFREVGSIEVQGAMAGARELWPDGSPMVTIIALLLLGGAVGKSAQVPLQTWLPDAMAGPTPVSALIHAATMVTAGVYLIARTHDLFLLSPTAQLAVASGRPRDALHFLLHGPRAAGHQARARLLHDEPDRLHVPGPGRRRVVRRHLPPDDPCLLQGAALPGIGVRDPRAPPRTGHVQDGRAVEEAADPVREHVDRLGRAGRAAVHVGLLQQGRHRARELRVRRVFLARRHHRGIHDRALHDANDGADLLRRSEERTP